VGSLARDGFGAVEIAEMLSADAPAVSSAVVAPPTDQTALRDRIAEALMRWTERGNSPQYAAMRRPEPVRANAYSRADAVLAVLPPSVDRAAAIASCPGYEASPSPCRCPCCGCQHHCGAHNPDDVPAPTAPLAWVDGHPQLEAIAAAVWEQCGRSDNGACVDDDPRNIAVAALSAVRNTADAPDAGAAPPRPAGEAPDTTTARGCPPDCPCRAACIGTLRPAAGARQDGAQS